MAKPHVDRVEHGTIRWFKSFGPTATHDAYRGPCSHQEGASHFGHPIAWGWDQRHYTLEECSRCHARAWHDERIRPTTLWLASRPQEVRLEPVSAGLWPEPERKVW